MKIEITDEHIQMYLDLLTPEEKKQLKKDLDKHFEKRSKCSLGILCSQCKERPCDLPDRSVGMP